jgi:hypothetical protein
MPYSHQATIGLQRQLGDTMAIDADYTYVGTRDVERPVPTMNVTFNPDTGANYPITDVSRRVWPWWGFTKLAWNGMRANQHSLQTAFTKRMSDGWQVFGTYTLSVFRDATAPARSGFDLLPFPVAPDLTSEYTLAVADQRHRFVVNGIWQLPYDFQVSGLYFFGSGERFETRWGSDLRRLGSTNANSVQGRLRPDGTIVPRNDFVQDPVHRVDVRLQRRFALGGRAAIDGLVEVFNLFNHANFGDYNINQSSRNFGQPDQSDQVAYFPRTMQLGFRFTF